MQNDLKCPICDELILDPHEFFENSLDGGIVEITCPRCGAILTINKIVTVCYYIMDARKSEKD